MVFNKAKGKGEKGKACKSHVCHVQATQSPLNMLVYHYAVTAHEWLCISLRAVKCATKAEPLGSGVSVEGIPGL